MSLVRLLTAGKSFVGLKGAEGRYRLSNQRLLPKFDPKKGPHGPGTPGQAEPAEKAPGGAIPAAATPPASEAPAPKAQALSGTVPRPARNPEPLVSKLWQRCCSGVRHLLPWRRRSPVSIPARSQARRLFQAELSLEAVKVVRNDLSDSDLEVVPRRPPMPTRRATSGHAAAEEELANRRWGKVAGRLFGAGKR